jgi:hypothetical protein
VTIKPRRKAGTYTCSRAVKNIVGAAAVGALKPPSAPSGLSTDA